MFKDRDGDVMQLGGGSAAAATLSHIQILGVPDPTRLVRFSSFADRYEQWRQRISLALADIDFAPDLARDIGSRRWLRGAATLIGLSALALAAWPNFAPLESRSGMTVDEEIRDQFRSQMIMPLALGADSGRRMGATREVVPLKSAPERPRLDLIATLSKGDSFERMLRRSGVGEGEAEHIADLVAGTMPLSDIAPGTKVDITLGRRPSPDAARPLDGLSFRARFDLKLDVARQNGRLVVEPRPIKVDTTPLRIRGIVGTSLYRSARNAGAPAKAVQQYLRTLGEEMDVGSGIAASDEFDLIVDYKRAATGDVETGDLLYAGLIRNGKPRKQLMRWGKDGRFYEASGVGETRTGLVAPVPGRQTSGYGMRRHPILGYMRMHKGIDFKASYGEPIHAVTDGTVEFAGRHGGHGNFVKLQHGGGLETGYAHMSRIAVKRGQHVRRGQVIGYVGSTGLSTGPHLHYELYRNGKTVNPTSVRFVTRSQLKGSELQAFKAKLASLQKVTPGAALAAIAPDPAMSKEPVREIDRIETKQKVG